MINRHPAREYLARFVTAMFVGTAALAASAAVLVLIIAFAQAK